MIEESPPLSNSSSDVNHNNIQINALDNRPNSTIRTDSSLELDGINNRE